MFVEFEPTPLDHPTNCPCTQHSHKFSTHEARRLGHLRSPIFFPQPNEVLTCMSSTQHFLPINKRIAKLATSQLVVWAKMATVFNKTTFTPPVLQASSTCTTHGGPCPTQRHNSSLQKGQWRYYWRLAEVRCLLVENHSNSCQVWSSRSFFQFYGGFGPTTLYGCKACFLPYFPAATSRPLRCSLPSLPHIASSFPATNLSTTTCATSPSHAALFFLAPNITICWDVHPPKKYRSGWLHRKLLKPCMPRSAMSSTLWERAAGSSPNTSR